MTKFRILFFLTLLSSSVFSQRFHIGIFGGVAAYNGDLADKVFPKKVTNGAIGGSLNYDLTQHFTLRGQLTYSVLGGADRFSKDPELRLRNLSFETQLFEASLVAEYYVQNLYEHRFTPYIFAGIGAFRFNPYAYDENNTQVFLRNFRTEGQGLPGYPGTKPYSFNQFNIPFGGGVKFAITDRLRVGIELSMRKLFTDYLDDVSGNYADPNDLALVSPVSVAISYRSDEVGGPTDYPTKGAQRGSPKYKDFYYFTGLHITYGIGNGSPLFGSEGGGRSNNKRLGCPVNVY